MNGKETGLINLDKKRPSTDCRKIIKKVIPNAPLDRNVFLQTKFDMEEFDQNRIHNYVITGWDADHDLIYLIFDASEISKRARQHIHNSRTQKIWIRGIFEMREPHVYVYQQRLKVFTDNKPICGRNE